MVNFLRIMQALSICAAVLALVNQSYFALMFFVVAVWYEFEIKDLL